SCAKRLHRINPADSRIRKLAAETPASYQAFDILVETKGKSLLAEPLRARRQALEEFFKRNVSENAKARIRLSPATQEVKQARRWMAQGAASGLDGVVAKRA